ncbi:oligopeptide transport system ATP-binding protein [Celeribacter persicus]|uniref:Oligopeptide transport system ATP-binding protein n=2 Tax=Celeribacter persicus TaxID=1651082 RepID=A0A2T5HVU5_9RHOB|nr:oligopeptide transport system ATP-binding protein [Celeribacter persicus]
MTIQKPLLSVRNLRVWYPIRKGGMFSGPPVNLTAVDDISFDLYPGETLGIVGESGCGKSTLARAIMQMMGNVSGQVMWLGKDLGKLHGSALRAERKTFQMIFQDPLAALNPRMTVAQIISEPLRFHFPELSKAEITERTQRMMGKVGLRAEMINRYPHQFSGGQCQRIGIARALILEPQLIICDEPVSALDVSIQAQVLNLLKDLQEETGVALIFIAHDLSVIRHISDRIMVLYLGNVMEQAESAALCDTPCHPYTQALISAVPIADPDMSQKTGYARIGDGDLPSPLAPPPGCVFHTRCPRAQVHCSVEKPPLSTGDQNRRIACHFPDTAQSASHVRT